MSEKYSGHGTYNHNELVFRFDIELCIENENFSGIIFNEKPYNPETNPSAFGINLFFSEAEIVDGKAYEGILTFRKIYPSPTLLHVFYELFYDYEKNKFSGTWKRYFGNIPDDKFLFNSDMAEIVFS